jgi:predicted cation transporter
MVTIWLLTILILVLFLPFALHAVEKELEIFLFLMGALAVTVTGQWSAGLVKEALLEPLKITAAVLVFGLLFRALERHIGSHVNGLLKAIGARWFVFLVVVLLGFFSSLITAIIAALVLVEVIGHLKLDKNNEILIVVFSCFSIGMGAALTPIGEPLGAIATGKLAQAPHFAGFWFLFKNLGMYIIPGVLLCGILAAVLVKEDGQDKGLKEDREEKTADIFIRAGKVYLFVMGLVFLGSGFKPVIDAYISKVPFFLLYWINISSAMLDNATLTAAEIGPQMQLLQIKSAILGLIISGGMLIPGNIPNIIAANKLKIKSSEWAKVAVPAGLGLMAVFFVVIVIFR